ncbi:Carbohydrate esterase 4 protein [Tulasnella sp. 417]|nr:Carbohydrate esterase 4 protein [Tulasnella sp. 417]
MFTTPRIFAASLLATLASALPSKLPELPQNQDLNIVRRATAEVYTQCFAPDTVAITFDDGPYIYNTDIVNILKDYNATATFFVNGNNYECIYSPENEERLKYALSEGHQIASHTWQVFSLTDKTVRALNEEDVPFQGSP